MVLSLPATDKALANVVLIALTANPAAGSGIPTVTETNAGKFITCHVYDEAMLFPATQNTGDGPRKACVNTVPAQLGTVKYAVDQIQYSYKPQLLGTPGNAANLAYETFVPGSTLTLVQILGVSGTISTVTAGMVANIYKVTVGAYVLGATGTGELDELSVTSQLALVNGEPIALSTVLA